MREIGKVADEVSARRLADYLLTQDITTRLEPRPDGWAVWVHREEQVDRGRQELAGFVAAPDDPKYREAARVARDKRKEAERRERQHRRNSIDLRAGAGYRPFRRCPLTFFLIAASVVVAFVTNLGSDLRPIRFLSLSTAPAAHAEVDEEGHVRIVADPAKGNDLDAVRRGEVWRLVTPIFIHFGPFHLLFNMIWLYELGGLIEMRRGTLALAAIVLVSAVASNLGEFYWDMIRHREALAGGMSGVVYALFGYVWMKGKYDPESGLRLRDNVVRTMIIWLFLCMTGLLGPIGNAAHVVGLLVGMLLGFAPHAAEELRR